jgi:D-ala D-ala ligase C-terminus
MTKPPKLVFVESSQPQIERSFDPHDIAEAVGQMGIASTVIAADTVSELHRKIARLREENRTSSLLLWPTTYVLGPSPSGPPLLNQLERTGLPTVGSRSLAFAINSKITLNREAVRYGIPTPKSIVQLPTSDLVDPPFDYPVVLKTEHGTDSVGVSVARSRDELLARIAEYAGKFREPMVIQEWCEGREFTVALIGRTEPHEIAVLGLQYPRGPLGILNHSIKMTFEGLTFPRPDQSTVRSITELTSQIASKLDLGDYARIDVLQNRTDGRLFVIDINLLPALDNRPEWTSYFPLAFYHQHHWIYEQTIAHILYRVMLRSELSVPAAIRELVTS